VWVNNYQTLDKQENDHTSAGRFYSGVNTSVTEYKNKLFNTTASVITTDKGYSAALTAYQEDISHFTLVLSSDNKTIISHLDNEIEPVDYNPLVWSVKIAGKSYYTSNERNLFSITNISCNGSAKKFTISSAFVNSLFSSNVKFQMPKEVAYLDMIGSTNSILGVRWLNKVTMKNMVMELGFYEDSSSCVLLTTNFTTTLNIRGVEYGNTTISYSYLDITDRISLPTTASILQYKEVGLFKYESLNKMFLATLKTNNDDNVFYVIIVIAKFKSLTYNEFFTLSNYFVYNNIPDSIQNKICANAWASSDLTFFFYSKKNTDWKLGYGKGLGTVRGDSAVLTYANGWDTVNSYYEDDASTLDLRNAVANLYVQDMIFNQASNKVMILCNDSIGSWGYNAEISSNNIFLNTQTNVILFFMYNGKKWIQINTNMVDPYGFINTYNSSVTSKGEEYRPDFNCYRDGYIWCISYTYPSNSVGGTKSYYTTMSW